MAVIEDNTHVTVPLPPGRHNFYLSVGNAPPQVSRLRARVSAGKTYVVRLSAKFSAKDPVAVEVLRRELARLHLFPKLVGEKKPRPSQLQACDAWLKKKHEKLGPKLTEADDAWSNADDATRKARTVRSSNGWTAAEVQAP